MGEGERIPACRSLAGIRASPRGREKGSEGCWYPKLLLLGTSSYLPEQERMLMFAEQFQGMPHTAGHLASALRPYFSEAEAEAQRGKATCPSHTILQW